jgi:hypothetical protein
MELSTLLFVVAMLACPIGMGVMMWMMNRNMSAQQQGHTMPGQASASDRLKALQDQRRLLEQEIAEVEKIAVLEAKKEALTHADSSAEVGQPQMVESARH